MRLSALNEIIRKIIHFSTIIIPLCYRYLFLYNRKQMLLYLGPIAILSILIDLMRLENDRIDKIFKNIFGILLRGKEQTGFTSATYLLVGAVVCIAFFPATIAFAALFFVVLGDLLAAITGSLFAKRTYRNSHKSLEGSIACFTGTLLLGIIIFNSLPLALVGAILTTIAETLIVIVDDNVSIPLISGLGMSLLGIFL